MDEKSDCGNGIQTGEGDYKYPLSISTVGMIRIGGINFLDSFDLALGPVQERVTGKSHREAKSSVEVKLPQYAVVRKSELVGYLASDECRPFYALVSVSYGRLFAEIWFGKFDPDLSPRGVITAGKLSELFEKLPELLWVTRAYDNDKRLTVCVSGRAKVKIEKTKGIPKPTKPTVEEIASSAINFTAREPAAI